MGRTDAYEQEDAPMLAAGLFEVRQRPRRDSGWTLGFLIVCILTVVGGIYAGTHRDKKFSQYISHDYLNDPRNCPAPVNGPARSLLSDDEPDYKPTYFLEQAGVWTTGSIIGGLGLGLLALWLFRYRPHGMVGMSIGLQVGIPAAMGIALVASGAGAGAIPLFIFSAILAFTFYLYRQQLGLVGRLLSIAAHCIAENKGLVAVALLVQAGSLVLLLPFVAFMFLAYMNGSVAPNAQVARVSKEGVCLAEDGSEQLCCMWVPQGWAIAYMSWTAIAMSWTMLLMFTIQLYIISGVTAQWYFAPVNGPKPTGAILRSTRYALGPSFGSLCLASWLLNLIQMIRSMLDNARRENQGNLCMALLISCLDFLYQILEQLTKFGVVRMAITGEGFMDACRGATRILVNNLLDTVGVWWFPGLILQMTALVLSVAWGLTAGGVSYLYWGSNSVALASAVAVGVVAMLFAALALGFINSLLLSVVEAVYMCFAMDREAHACTRMDVHEVYMHLPSYKGTIVEQPDGGYMYGAQPPPAAPAPYAAPYGQPYGGQQYAAPAVTYPSVPRV